jgi:hypothetical protein
MWNWLKGCWGDFWKTLWSSYPEPANYPAEVQEVNQWGRDLVPSETVSYGPLLEEARRQYDIALTAIERLHARLEWAFGVATAVLSGVLYFSAAPGCWYWGLPAIVAALLSLHFILKAKVRSAIPLPLNGRALHILADKQGTMTPYLFASVTVAVAAFRAVNLWKYQHLKWASNCLVLAVVLAAMVVKPVVEHAEQESQQTPPVVAPDRATGQV